MATTRPAEDNTARVQAIHATDKKLFLCQLIASWIAATIIVHTL